MNIYSDSNNGDNPVGFSYSKVETNGKKIKTYEKSTINIKAFEVENSISSTSEYILVDNQIESFNYILESFPESYKISGKAKNGKIIITTITNSDSQTKEYEAYNDYLVPSLFPLWLADGRLITGANYEIYIFDPFMIASDFPKEKLLSKIKIYEKETIFIGSENISAYKVDYNFLGVSSTLWIQEDGTIVKEIIPPGFISERSAKDVVQAAQLKSFDIISKTSIQPDKEIKNSRKAKRMRFKLSDIDETGLDLVDSYNQFKRNGIYEIKIGDINTDSLNFDFNKNDFNNYLSSTKFVQSENEAIKTAQNSITKGSKNKLEGIRSINKWIYDNIEKTPVFSVPNALDVLKSKKGDCNEHSVLFAALARSYGVPSKIVLGLVYLNGRFYYHAWNEVYLGKWIPVDATFGQLPSDATHIKLIEGSIEKSVDILKLVGKLNIQILEVYY